MILEWLNIEQWIQFGTVAVALLALLIKHQGMKNFIPVGMFASLYSNIACYIGKYFNLWEFPARLFSSTIEDIPITVNIVLVPIIAMFWIRYAPLRLRGKIMWAVLWSAVFSAVEFFIERYTELLQYYQGYQFYHSFLFWFISFFIWYGFHLWMNDGRRDFDSMFR
ncbi:MAG: competence protein [Firmicutes bacterium]|nr:competence protein [Bacillota bacterium]